MLRVYKDTANNISAFDIETFVGEHSYDRLLQMTTQRLFNSSKVSDLQRNRDYKS